MKLYEKNFVKWLCGHPVFISNCDELENKNLNIFKWILFYIIVIKNEDLAFGTRYKRTT
jgi:hypothetical protein